MVKYRKKPIEIEAFKWTGDIEQTEDPIWIVEAIKNGDVWFNNKGTKDVTMIIRTLEGNLIADRGDYIIKGVKGELYPCKANIFDMTYEDSEQVRDLIIVTDISRLTIGVTETGDIRDYIYIDEDGNGDVIINGQMVINKESFKYCYLDKVEGTVYETSYN